VHEVHADDALGARGDRGQARDRDRARVAGQDRTLAGGLVERLEDPLLQGDVLGGGLDGQVGLDRLVRRGDPGDGGLGGAGLDAALLDQLGQRALDAAAGAVELVAGDVDQRDVVPGHGRHLGDAGAHLARPDDADPLAHAAMTSSTVASPWAAPEQIAATPLPPPRRRSSWMTVPSRRAPEAPMGWPSATAPPFTFTRSGSMPSRSTVFSATEQKASFTSSRSMSDTASPAFSST